MYSLGQVSTRQTLEKIAHELNLINIKEQETQSKAAQGILSRIFSRKDLQNQPEALSIGYQKKKKASYAANRSNRQAGS